MPLVLNKFLTDQQILSAIAEAYAEEQNWIGYEKDYGQQGPPVIRAPWSSRDLGAYARRGLAIINERTAT